MYVTCFCSQSTILVGLLVGLVVGLRARRQDSKTASTSIGSSRKDDGGERPGATDREVWEARRTFT